MTDTHDILVDAAEELVRAEGLAALSMRSLASRTNYGKSTVHEAIGSTEQLIAELRVRAVNDMLGAAVGDLDPDPQSETWRAGMYRRIAQWMIDNPTWAEMCFRPEGATGKWANGVATILIGVLPAGVADLTPEDALAFSQLSVRTVGAVVPLVASVQDVDFGAEAVETAFLAVYSDLVRLVELRGLDSATVNPSLRNG